MKDYDEEIDILFDMIKNSVETENAFELKKQNFKNWLKQILKEKRNLSLPYSLFQVARDLYLHVKRRDGKSNLLLCEFSSEYCCNKLVGLHIGILK